MVRTLLTPFKTKVNKKFISGLGYEYPVFEETYDVGGKFVLSRKFNEIKFDRNATIRPENGPPTGYFVMPDEDEDSQVNTNKKWVLNAGVTIITYEGELIASTDPRNQADYAMNCFNGWRVTTSNYRMTKDYLDIPTRKIEFVSRPSVVRPSWSAVDERYIDITYPAYTSLKYYRYNGNNTWELLRESTTAMSYATVIIGDGLRIDSVGNNTLGYWLTKRLLVTDDYRDHIAEILQQPEHYVSSPYLYLTKENPNIGANLTLILSGGGFEGQTGFLELQDVIDEGVWYHNEEPTWLVENIPDVIDESYALPPLPKQVPGFWLFPPTKYDDLQPLTLPDPPPPELDEDGNPIPPELDEDGNPIPPEDPGENDIKLPDTRDWEDDGLPADYINPIEVVLPPPPIERPEGGDPGEE